MATHSSVLVWRIPGTGEPGGLPDVYGVSQSRTRLKRLSSSSSSICIKNFQKGAINANNTFPLIHYTQNIILTLNQCLNYYQCILPFPLLCL